MKSALAFTSIALSFFAALPQQTQAEEYHLGFRIAPRISTLGGGLEVAQGVTPWLGLRGGVNYFTYNYETTESGNDYDIDLELKSFGLFADIHPFKQAFRLSVGFLINGNAIDGKATLGPGEKFELDGTEYSLQGNAATMELTYGAFAPYAGIGFDSSFGDDERWGFVFDLGIVYSGTPDLVINAAVDPNDPNKADFEEQKKKEVDQLQEDLNQFEFYPVLSTGIVYQF